MADRQKQTVKVRNRSFLRRTQTSELRLCVCSKEDHNTRQLTDVVDTGLYICRDDDMIR